MNSPRYHSLLSLWGAISLSLPLSLSLDPGPNRAKFRPERKKKVRFFFFFSTESIRQGSEGVLYKKGVEGSADQTPSNRKSHTGLLLWWRGCGRGRREHVQPEGFQTQRFQCVRLLIRCLQWCQMWVLLLLDLLRWHWHVI